MVRPTGIRLRSSTGPSAALKERVRRPALFNKLAKPEDLVKLFKNGDSIGWSGFTGVGLVSSSNSSLRT